MRNDDADWDAWHAVDYVDEIYGEMSRVDAEIIAHHCALYRQFAPGSLARTVELGAGPNLYPLLLAAGASRHVDAVERGAANVAYLRHQLDAGPDPTWQPFYDHCRRHNPALPATMAQALSRVRVVHRNALATPVAQDYDLASMHFVAESVTEDADEFAAFCATFVRTVRPGGHLVAAFVAGLHRYQMRSGPQWPAYPVDADVVARVFEPLTEELDVGHVDPDQLMIDYGTTGVVVLTARRRGGGPG